MHPIVKTLWWVVNPANLLLIALVAGALMLRTKRRALGVRLLVASALFAGAVTVLPVGSWLITTLENRIPQPTEQALAAPVAGIIVLGGASNPTLAAARNQIALSASSERLVVGAALARRYPGATLIFTGGSAKPIESVHREADVARRVFEALGVDPGRVRLERNARNTWENVAYVKKMAQQRVGGQWLLVTSAAHMPRSYGVFRARGVDVLPYPVDYETPPTLSWIGPLSLHHGLGQLNHGLREWAALIYYRMRGRTKSLFPTL